VVEDVQKARERIHEMKLYLMVSNRPGQVHGVDYTRGLEDGRKCGKVHEFCTKTVNGKCCVVLWTEEEAGRGPELKPDEWVELTPVRSEKKIESIVWGE
jgi:hypothetical protein